MSGVRAQLNLLVAAITALVLIAFLVPFGVLLRRAAEDRAISTATLQAQSIAALVSLGQTPTVTRTPQGPVVTVFYGDGRVAGAAADRTPSIELAARGQSFTAAAGDGVEVLVPVQGLPDGTAVVRAYAASLDQGVARTWGLLALLGLALFGLALLLADRLGRRLVVSVTELAATADRLAAGDLAARVRPSPTPELHRVGLEVNRLAGRIQELLAAQREESADLAHRLRTPMTAVRLEIDSMPDGPERQRLDAAVGALHRLIDEVIRTARRPAREGAGAAADLVAVAADRVAFWSALAQDAGRPVDSILPAGPILVRASEADLAAALDALLENVFSHTPDGTPLEVEVSGLPEGGGRITVSDGGPGLAAAQAGRGISAGGSTGLGLDIARRTAESAGGQLRTHTSNLGGAAVELTLQPPT
jgi:signal transduction histidine kinase